METVNVLITIAQVLGLLIILYVTKELAAFQNVLLEKINGKYLSRNEAELQKEQNKADHERFEREFDQIWGQVNKLK